MKTPDEQSTTSTQVTRSERPEEFGPPEITNLASLTDGRALGSYQSAYGLYGWLQIAAELLYLSTALGGSFFCLALLAKHAVLKETSGPIFALIGNAETATPLIVYASVTLAGVCGGCASSLKWLYHSVAKRRWHRDRVLWRVIVPPLSGILAAFTSLMIISGIVPFLNRSSLAGPAAGAALGFFVGLFSDNLLAALEKIAFQVFGTLGEKAKDTGASSTGAAPGDR